MVNRVGTIIATLRYARKWSGQVIVVKCGWDVVADRESLDAMAEDVALLRHQAGVRVVLIHGAGKAIDAALKRRGLEPETIDGLRVTPLLVLRVVRAVATKTSRQLVQAIGKYGGLATNMLDRTGNRWMHAMKRNSVAADGTPVNLGFVGDVTSVDREPLLSVLDNGGIPVVTHLGRGSAGRYFNVNADVVAAKIAEALHVKRVVFLSNVPGIRTKDGVVVRKARRKQLTTWLSDGTIHGGMIPKVKACLAALDAGVESVTITDGREYHQLLFELFTEEGAGTLITDE